MKGSDLWGGNRNVRYLQSDTNSMLWEEEENSQSFSRGQIWHKVLCCCSLQDIGYSWATQSGCAPHIPDEGTQPGACTCYRETGMNIRKTTVWKNGLTSSQKDQLKPKQSIHASVTHHASTISHIPVKNPTTMQSWEKGNPKVCFDLWSSP